MKPVPILLFVLILCYLVISYQQAIINNLEKELQIHKSNEEYSKEFTLIDPKLLKAIEIVESNSNPNAFNKHTNAIGKMQLTPIVYAGFCNLSKEGAKEEKRHMACANLYLYYLQQKYRGNLQKILTFYNSGYKNNNPRYYPKVKKMLDKLNK